VVSDKENDSNDRTIRTMKEEKGLLHATLTSDILGSCFEVMKELGPGFLERVYKNALFIAMKERGLQVQTEVPFEVIFREKLIGRYSADLIVERTVIVELKCCDQLVREHQAQLFNYLKVAQMSVGLLVNFRRRQLEWKRLQSNEDFCDAEDYVEEKVPF